MTLAKAHACGAAATNAGFDVTITKMNGGTGWKVRVTSGDLDINVEAAAALATAQNIVGKVSLVEFT